jgi:hypothetical protein
LQASRQKYYSLIFKELKITAAVNLLQTPQLLRHSCGSEGKPAAIGD